MIAAQIVTVEATVDGVPVTAEVRVQLRAGEADEIRNRVIVTIGATDVASVTFKPDKLSDVPPAFALFAKVGT